MPRLWRRSSPADRLVWRCWESWRIARRLGSAPAGACGLANRSGRGLIECASSLLTFLAQEGEEAATTANARASAEGGIEAGRHRLDPLAARVPDCPAAS